MIKERIPISGDLKSKVKQLMEYAGWREGRKVDISIAEQYYADHGVPMMKTTRPVLFLCFLSLRGYSLCLLVGTGVLDGPLRKCIRGMARFVGAPCIRP